MTCISPAKGRGGAKGGGGEDRGRRRVYVHLPGRGKLRILFGLAKSCRHIVISIARYAKLNAAFTGMALVSIHPATYTHAENTDTHKAQ